MSDCWGSYRQDCSILQFQASADKYLHFTFPEKQTSFQLGCAVGTWRSDPTHAPFGVLAKAPNWSQIILPYEGNLLEVLEFTDWFVFLIIRRDWSIEGRWWLAHNRNTCWWRCHPIRRLLPMWLFHLASLFAVVFVFYMATAPSW